MPFYVHESLIRESSAFFDRVLTDDERRNSDSIVWLPEGDPDHFRLYPQWLYRGTVPSRSDAPDDEEMEYELLAGAYVLGERLKDGILCDFIIDSMIQKSNTKATDGTFYCPSWNNIEYIYKNARASSPARRLVVCLYVLHGNKDWLVEWKNIPKDFPLDFALALLDKPSLTNLRQDGANTCEYHQHRSTTPCYKSFQGRRRSCTEVE